MFNSSAVAEAIGTDRDFDEVDSIVEVQLRSSQPLPDKVGLINGKYLIGSNESTLIWMNSPGCYGIISMDDLYRIYSVPAVNRRGRLKRFLAVIAASEPYLP